MSDVSTRLLKFKINGTEYTAAAGTAKINAADSDSDFTSFADAAAGGAKDHTLQVTIKQDLAPGSLWRMIYQSAGATVSFLGNIYGNTTASDTQPFMSGTLTIPAFDGDYWGGDADKSTTAKMTFDSSWAFAAQPALVTSGGF
jgi:hypothetical protein